jgi:hypothetical protein
MVQFIRRLKQPASSSHLAVALAVTVVALSLMVWGVI